MNACCVVGAGDFKKFDLNKHKNDFIIAADGGYKHLMNSGIKPDLAVGDFDSLGFRPLDIETVELPVQKDVTDMKAAVDIGIKKGYKEFYIYGGCGGRIDHTISNIQLAASLVQEDIKVNILDDISVITAIHNGSLHLECDKKGYISILAHSDICRGVTVKGLKYTLCDAELNNTFPLGVSNEFIGQESEIHVSDGTLIVIYSH